jgi:neutral amino acid transport system permease protein
VDWGQIITQTLQSAVGREAVVWALLAIGLNVHFGYTGLLNFGQVGFMAVGAYGMAISVTEFGWSVWVGILVGLGGAALLALLLGIPTLRLRADYLAIVTIAAAEIFRRVMAVPNFKEVTGGADGLSAFAGGFYDVNPIPDGNYGFGPWRYDGRETWQLLVGWGVVLLAVLVTYLLMRSPWGRVVRAIREDEDAARSLGKNAFGYKMQSLLVGGLIGALGGMMFALWQSALNPGAYAPGATFLAYTALILGGAARIWGPVIGSAILWGLLRFADVALRQAIDAGYVSDSVMTTAQVGSVRFILMGVILALLVIFRPQGIFGDPREIALEPR